MSLIAKLRTANDKRLAYRQVLAGFNAMPDDVALSLGVTDARARALAFKAVYVR